MQTYSWCNQLFSTFPLCLMLEQPRKIFFTFGARLFERAHSYFRHNIAYSRTYYMLVTEYRAYYITVTWPSGNLCVLPTPCMLFLDVNVVSDLHVVLSLWWLCLLGLVCFTQTWLLLLHFLRPLATNVLLGFVLLQWGWFHIWSCRELFSAVTLAVT